MEKITAFVLGGGGSHGALQVGALRALLEAGIVPNLLVGTSIGAVNAAGLALWGADPVGISALERAWDKVSGAQVLDTRIRWLFLKAVMSRPGNSARRNVERYLESEGFTRDLRFKDIPRVRLAIVSADIATGRPVIYGQNPEDSVLEGLLASIALPPWFAPLQKDSQEMIDGGALSNLPIESALRLGATDIVALDLDDSFPGMSDTLPILQYMRKYLYAVRRRQVYLETALAVAKGVPVRCVEFRGLAKKPIWDFTGYQDLIRAGYEQTAGKIAEWARMDEAELVSLRSRTEESKDHPSGRPARIPTGNARGRVPAPEPLGGMVR